MTEIILISLTKEGSQSRKNKLFNKEKCKILLSIKSSEYLCKV